VAIDVLLLAQLPPKGEVVSNEVPPSHIINAPVILAGTGFTVIKCASLQPVGRIYEITTDPAARPVTTPDVPATARVTLLLIQLPPAAIPVSVVVVPVHNEDAPVIETGRGFMVTTTDREHPVGIT
jgi:hypothetical protein